MAQTNKIKSFLIVGGSLCGHGVCFSCAETYSYDHCITCGEDTKIQEITRNLQLEQAGELIMASRKMMQVSLKERNKRNAINRLFKTGTNTRN